MKRRIKTSSLCVFPVMIMWCLWNMSASVCYTQTTDTGTANILVSLIPPGTVPRLVIDSGNEPGIMLSEGPTWFNGKFYFSNIHYPEKRGFEGLYVLNDNGSYTVLNKDIQSEGIKPLFNGNLAVCDLKSRSILEVSPAGKVVGVLADSCEGSPLGPPNDIIVDDKGGLYFTVPFQSGMPGTTVYYRKPDGTVIRMIGWNELKAPNGCLLSADYSKLFITDSRDTAIWVFDVAGDGTLTNKRQFAALRLPEGKESGASGADGMTMDVNGNLFFASMMGIQIFDKNGAYLGCVPIPQRPTHCIFGGNDLSTLYVTCFVNIYAIQTITKGYQYPIPHR